MPIQPHISKKKLTLLILVSSFAFATGVQHIKFNLTTTYQAKGGDLIFANGFEDVQITYADVPTPAEHTLTQNPSSSTVGFTSGNLNVDMGGNASYSLPIYTPSGTGGMQPGLSLVYNSGDTSNNIAGVGWSIGGISSISRCLKNAEQDGITQEQHQPINLTNDDAFCLDGQKLKLLSGTNGTNNAQYRTELESFSKITVIGVQSEGPAKFEVRLKNGEIREYGSSSANYNAQIKADGTNKVVTWLLNKISDRHGNEIWYVWDNDNTSGETYLDKIDYTRRGNNPNFQNQIKFNYEARADINISYSQFRQQKRIKRLSSITTKRKKTVNTAFVVVRELKIGYTYSALTNSSIVTSIRSCANSATSSCLKPVVFDWSSQASDIGFGAQQSSGSIMALNKYRGYSKTIDLNGDGRKEIIFPRQRTDNLTNPEVRFYTVGNSDYINLDSNDSGSCANATGYFNRTCNLEIQPAEPEDHEITNNDYFAYDFNGDGKEDLLAPVKVQGQSLSHWQISYSNGEKICKSSSSGAGCINSVNTNIQWKEGVAGGTFSDFTADGLPDLMRFNTFSYAGDDFASYYGNGNMYISHMNAANSSIILDDQNNKVSITIDTSQMPITMDDIYCWDGNSIGAFEYELCEYIVAGFDNQNPINLPSMTELVSISALANDFNSDGLSDVLISYRILFHEIACSGGTRRAELLTRGTNPDNYPLKESDCWVKFWAVHTYEPTATAAAQLKHLQTIGMSVGDGMDDAFLSNDNGMSVYQYDNPYLDLGNDDNIQALDFNGDGLTDIITDQGILINNGTDFNDIINFNRESDGDYIFTGGYTYSEKAADFKHLTQFLDYDYDGDLDILYPEPESSDAYVRYRYRTLDYDTTNGYSFSAKIDTNTVARSKDAQATTVFNLFEDFNGDSFIDHFYVKLAPGDEKFTEFGKGAWKPKDKITKISKTASNGLRDETTIKYESASLPTVYARTYDGFGTNWGNGTAVFDISAANMYLVREISTLSPIKHSSNNTTVDNISSVFYHYKGLKVQGGGRGSLGFSETSSVDIQNNLSTQSLYRQDFPVTGSPHASLKNHHPSLNNITSNGFSCTVGQADCAYSACSGASCFDPIINGTAYDPLYDAVNEYTIISPASDADTHFVFMKKSIEDFYELGSNSILKTHITEMDYENKTTPASFYGNVAMTSSKICSTYNAGVCTLISSSSVSNTYNNSSANINNWILGRLSSATSTKSRRKDTVNPTFFTINNNSSFTYNSTTGQLETETSGTGNNQLIRTTRIHDIYGNETDTLLCSQSVIAAGNCNINYLPDALAADQLDIYRHSKNIYDSNWNVFVDESKTLFGTQGNTASMHSSSQVIARDTLGNITKAIDLINNITTESVYGLFGELQATKTNAGTYSQTLNSWCTTSTCPNNAAVVSTTTTAGAPTNKEYKDAQGRTTRVQTQFMGTSSNPGTWSTIDNWYDESGRAKYTTVAYYAAASPTIYLAVNSYDALGRVIQSQSPNHAGTAITSTQYNGLEITTFNPNDQKKVTKYDETGKIIQINQYLNDHNLVYSNIKYYYEANDKLIRMVSDGIDVSPSTTRITYDNLGRKLTIEDPNKGDWEYLYNPIGDIIEQTDATGQKITFAYDIQGRTVTKTGSSLIGYQELDNQWFYDENGDIGKLTSEISLTATNEKIEKFYAYDNFGRAASITSKIYDGDNGNNHAEYMQTSTYDQYSRAFQNIDATGYGTMYLYDNYGYQHKTLEAAQCLSNFASCENYDGNNYRLYYQVIDMDSFGNISKDQLHKGSLTTIRSHNAKDGIMENTCIDTNPSPNCTGTPQDKIVLTFDKLGNLTNKTSKSGTETFTYDKLNRLKTENRSIGAFNNSLNYSYYANGNLKFKGADQLFYNGNSSNRQLLRPQAVTGFKGTTFNYDDNGNMRFSTNGNFRRTITYTGLNKAYEITNQNNNKSNYFIYDANHNRAVRKDSTNSIATKTTHYIGNVEMIKSAGNQKAFKRYIGPLIIDLPNTTSPQINWQYHYQLKDHLGSSHSIITLNTAGIQTNSLYMSFDAWGQRRFVTNTNVSDINAGDTQFSNIINKTTKGYTSHEHLDETGIIHMNGRIYTAYLGRFLQADPFIQDPYDTQSLNRFTYVGNNPLSANDPTGYWSVDAFMQSIGNPIISIALSAIPNAGPFLSGIFNGLQTKAATGSKRKALTSAFVTVGSAYAYAGIGDYYSTMGKLTASQFAGKIALHGLVGGASSLIQGGNFKTGFITAGATQSLSPAIGRFGRQGKVSPARVFAAAIVGGTASRLSGGKFANGAMTGAFSRLFNDERHEQSERQKNADKFVKDKYGDILDIGNINLKDNMEAAKSLSTSDFIDRVKSGGIWDYKVNNALVDQFDSKLLDEFGNFHFGMVAGAQGFSLNSTVTGAGAYQAFMQSGGNKFDAFTSITSSFAVGPNTSRVRREIMSGFSFGDNPGDSFNIMLGWDYFHINQTDTFHR